MRLRPPLRLACRDPRLVLVDVPVGEVGEGHHLAHRPPELARLVPAGDGVARPREPLEELPVVQLPREPPVREPVQQAGAARRDVHHLSHEVRVDPGDEVREVQVHVVDPVSELAREVVAQVLGVEVVGVGAGPDEGAPALRHLLAVHGEETVAEDRARHAEPGPVEARGPEQGVEVGDVLADEVVDLGGAVLRPEVVEAELAALRPDPAAQVLEARHVADGRVQPDVEVLARPVRDLEAEVGRVARDVPVLEALREPLVELVGDLGLDATPFVLPGRAEPPPHPVAQHRVEVRQPDEDLLGVTQLRGAPRDHRDGIAQIARVVGRPAELATVAELVRRPAPGTLAADVAIGQEHLALRIVEAGNGAREDVPPLAKAPVDALGAFPVLRRVGGVVVVETDVEGGEIRAVLLSDPFDERLRGDPFALRAQHDGGAVGVVRADEVDLRAAHALEPDPDVGLDVLDEVADVDGAVGVGERARDEDAPAGRLCCTHAAGSLHRPGRSGYGPGRPRAARGWRSLPLCQRGCRLRRELRSGSGAFRKRGLMRVRLPGSAAASTHPRVGPGRSLARV